MLGGKNNATLFSEAVLTFIGEKAGPAPPPLITVGIFPSYHHPQSCDLSLMNLQSF